MTQSMHQPITPGQGPVLRPWGLWSSAGWVVLAGFAQILVAYLLAVLQAGDGMAPDERANAMMWTSAIIAAPLQVALLAFAAKLRGFSAADYLALNIPGSRTAIFGVICLFVLLPTFDLSSHALGRDIVPSFVANAYRAAQSGGWMLWLVLAIVVAAPVAEELTFRGFLFRGWASTRLGPYGAIALTTVIWALLHVQYDWFTVLQIVILGLFLGWLRWTSGSALLTIGLHALTNTVALIETVMLVD